MNSNKILFNLGRQRGWLIIGILLIPVIALAVRMTVVTASPLIQMSDPVLTQQALATAHSYGLEGDPIALRSIRMTLAEWDALNRGQELGKDAAKFGQTPDTPVFVLAIRGKVTWRGPGLPRPGQTAPESFDNITIVIDARNGNTIQVGAARPGVPMPVPVPVVTLVPRLNPTPTLLNLTATPPLVPLQLRPTPNTLRPSEAAIHQFRATQQRFDAALAQALKPLSYLAGEIDFLKYPEVQRYFERYR